MQRDEETPQTQSSPRLRPPKPPGPPTLTAVGFAPELPDPDDQPRSRSARTPVRLPLQSGTEPSQKAPQKSVVGIAASPTDKALAVLAASAALLAAISIWISLLVTAL